MIFKERKKNQENLKQWPSIFKLLNTFIGDVGAALKPNLRLVSNYENENREEADSMQFSAKKNIFASKNHRQKTINGPNYKPFLPYFNRLTCFFTSDTYILV